MTPTRQSEDPGGRSGAVEQRRALGLLGEQFAAAHLERRGFRVLARNVRTRHGEIELIAHDGAVLAFVEVKTRRRRRDASREPLDGLRAAQRARLRRLATAWLAETEHRPRAHTIRFDAVGVTVDERGRLMYLEHLEGAW